MGKTLRSVAGLALLIAVIAGLELWARRASRLVPAWNVGLPAPGALAQRGVHVGRRGCVAVLDDTRIEVVGLDGKRRTIPVSRLSSGSVSVSTLGDVGVVSYRKKDDVSSALEVTRFGRDGNVWHVPVSGMRDDTCATGRVPPSAAATDDGIWIANPHAEPKLALYRPSGPTVVVDPCGCAAQKDCYCSLFDVTASEGGALVEGFRQLGQTSVALSARVLDDGSVRWRHEWNESPAPRRLAADGDLLLVGQRGGGTTALELIGSRGDRVWALAGHVIGLTPGTELVAAAFASDAIYVATGSTFTPSKLRAWLDGSPVTEVTLWQLKRDGTVHGSRELVEPMHSDNGPVRPALAARHDRRVVFARVLRATPDEVLVSAFDF